MIGVVHLEGQYDPKYIRKQATMFIVSYFLEAYNIQIYDRNWTCIYKCHNNVMLLCSSKPEKENCYNYVSIYYFTLTFTQRSYPLLKIGLSTYVQKVKSTLIYNLNPLILYINKYREVLLTRYKITQRTCLLFSH